jgi:hypothetical protein
VVRFFVDFNSHDGTEVEMSWGVIAIGRPAAVAAKLEKDFSNIHCEESEESIKNGVAAAVAACLAVLPPTMAVHVEVSGSEFVPDLKYPEEKYTQLTVKLETLYGFVG